MHCVRPQLTSFSSLSSRIAIDERETKNAPVFDENSPEGKTTAHYRMWRDLRVSHGRAETGKRNVKVRVDDYPSENQEVGTVVMQVSGKNGSLNFAKGLIVCRAKIGGSNLHVPRISFRRTRVISRRSSGTSSNFSNMQPGYELSVIRLSEPSFREVIDYTDRIKKDWREPG